MLQEVLELVRCAAGTPLSSEAVARSLGLSPEVAQHMLELLVRRGRLVQVEIGCTGCEVCPLHRFCAGASDGGFVRRIDHRSSHGYRIRTVDQPA